MKTYILLLISFFILRSTNLFSAPLNGTYTIGSGGNYPTINSAIADAETQGINGPVIFNIISGIYNENVSINSIPGSSLLNTLTLKSQSGNSSDVELNVIQITGSNISITNLSLNSGDINIQYGRNINIINNNLRNHGLFVSAVRLSAVNSGNIQISGNTNVSYMGFAGEYWFGAYSIDSVKIKNNIVNGPISFFYCFSFLVESNTIGGLNAAFNTDMNFNKNKITGLVDAIGNFHNNFIIGQIINFSGSNNTLVGGTLTTPTLPYLSDCRNNIIINPTGGPAAYSSALYSGSDYNVFYNGGNSNLINYGGISYNSVQDFYNATGKDQHSSDQPVNFVSPTDLHLAPASFGDPLLIGIHDDAVIDDIDGQTRSLTSPYKGADEPDIPLPVELSVFNSSVNVNNVNLYWTTTSETNNSGFGIERSNENQDWRNIGFVKGHGTTTATNNYEFSDKGLNPGKYNYRLKQLDYNGNYKYYNLSEEVLIGSPEKFSLSQNYPNPFNPVTVINYELPFNSNVQLKVYDISGKEVITLVNGFKEAGRYDVTFDGSNFASGVYYYKITSDNFSSVKKMFLIK
ncbi:MAG: T9SS type A sorting domain-containing protein [Bacteroidetes bacterium]|nr:T9SS type A sorting domain-containing protein [Bacteroidota bacterium]